MRRNHSLTLAALVTASLSAAGIVSAPLASASPGATAGGAVPVGGPPLRALAPARTAVGTALNMDVLGTDATYRAVAAREFNVVSPENVMKWEVVEPTRGSYDWRQADQLVAFAQRNRQRVRGHTLVWHNQLPSWLTSGSFTNAQLQALLKKHVQDEVRHFRGKIWQWDVVNEAFNDDGTPRQDIWYKAFGGTGYIAAAFRWAHEADPKALLFYNDYNIESVGAKSNAVLAMVKQLRARHVPIHGVGFQGHLDIKYPAPTDFGQNLRRFSSRGLDTAVTEADVRVNVPAGATEPTDAKELTTQARYFTVLLDGCLRTRRCISFTFWGFTDKYSWVPGTFPGEGAALILDQNYRPKPAYRAVQRSLVAAHRWR